MPDQPLMSIGMFSRASLLSIKSLRAYHDQGILIPATVNQSTGYRSYHPSQLVDATVLCRLRGLDLPLADVKEILTHRDPEVTRKVLADHHAQMSDRLRQTQQIVEDLQRAVDLPDEQTPVHLQTLDHQHVLAVSAVVPSPEFSGFFDRAFPLLGSTAAELGFVVNGPAGALYQGTIPDQAAEPVTAYLPVAEPLLIPEPTRGITLRELPRQQMAVLVHAGTYDTIGQSYAALGSWVAYNANREANAPESSDNDFTHVREIYEIGFPEAANSDDYRTRICWPCPS